MPVMAIVAKVTITPECSGFTNAITSIASPVTQFDNMSVFFRPQYFKSKIQTSVPKSKCECKNCSVDDG